MLNKPLLANSWAKTLSPTLITFLLAALGGLFIGVMVAGIRLNVGWLQTLFFGADVNSHGGKGVASWRLLCVPLTGGCVLGFFLLMAEKGGKQSIVDPVEANALFGGKMSLIDSLILVSLSILSISIGGSIGFEAAMTQLGAGLMSWLGQQLNLPRRELRILVSCGTGAGLAAIFGAPIAATFYALELVIGGYGMRALMPTLLATAMSSIALYHVMGNQLLFPSYLPEFPAFDHLLLALVIGFLASLVGIAVMRGTTALEYLLKKNKVKTYLKPAIGGLILGLIAFNIPDVMGPGHYSINEILRGQTQGLTLLFLLAKILATIVCVGSGFRGGLFSASLCLGAALGCSLYGLINVVLPGHPFFPLDLFVVAGMAGVAASVIGTPVAILLLMVETAGLHTGIITTTLTIIIASQLTLHWFGFSFSTWRFHVRGSDIAGPKDIGRLRALTFAHLPRKALSLISSTASRTELPFNKEHYLAVENAEHHFLGLLSKEPLPDNKISNASLVNYLLPDVIHVYENDAIEKYLDALTEDGIMHVVVLDENQRTLGFIAKITVIRYYLDEVLAMEQDELISTTACPVPKPR